MPAPKAPVMPLLSDAEQSSLRSAPRARRGQPLLKDAGAARYVRAASDYRRVSQQPAPGAARIQAETKPITDEIQRKHGVLNIAVDLIRETRDEA
jgi:hypothetical protein